MDQRFLRPNGRCPVPLNEDFWMDIVCFNGGERSAEVMHQLNQRYALDVEAEVERAVRENEGAIGDALMKQVAPSAVNVVGIQYENLISLSFDQEELIKQEENRQRRIRKRIVDAALRK
ncbi:unnamed protein product [Thelazia callipaeda]|uniref:CUE domain-containing protein n=1 Tax=Thelazia callipaeda TaxID=103827 RepID=A0A0N5CM95_THECL|nr:unnamed protein product [Thelazia callipaeda]